MEHGRKSKKRKFVLVGEQWGDQNQNGNRNLGLDCKLEEVVLDSNEIRSNQKNNNGAGPLGQISEQLGKVNETGIGISTDGNQKRKGETAPLISNNIQKGLMEPSMGTSPLLDDNVDKTKPNFGNQEIGGGTSPLLVPDMNQESEGGTSPLVCANGDDRALYDTATNVVRLREDRGDCVVRRGWCQEHDRMAR